MSRSEATACGVRPCTPLRLAPPIFGRRLDLAVFLGPAVVGLALVAGARALGLAPGPLPEWGWVAFVLAIDVAHVWATLHRTYLDPNELRRRPRLYALVPLGCFVVGAALHAHSSAWFWRALAYLAVFHFLRQQIGWAAIYRAREGDGSRLAKLVDDAALYLAMGVPLLLWHSAMPKRFSWFLPGDFVALPRLGPLVPFAQAALAIALLAWLARMLVRLRRGHPLPLGRLVLVATTALTWWVGIVTAGDDFSFTVLNVLPHGVPYVALLHLYGRARADRDPTTPSAWLIRGGLGLFFGSLFLFAFVEEALWDRLVFHDHEALFGFLPEAPDGFLPGVIVPLLALPQATHYVLDAVLWRRRDQSPAQAEAMGFQVRPAPTSSADGLVVHGRSAT